MQQYRIRADSLPPESVLARLQKDLSLQAGSEVNLLVLTPEKLERLKREGPPFCNSLVLNKVTLIGSPLKNIDDCFKRGLLSQGGALSDQERAIFAPGQGLAL